MACGRLRPIAPIAPQSSPLLPNAAFAIRATEFFTFSYSHSCTRPFVPFVPFVPNETKDTDKQYNSRCCIVCGVTTLYVVNKIGLQSGLYIKGNMYKSDGLLPTGWQRAVATAVKDSQMSSVRHRCANSVA